MVVFFFRYFYPVLALLGALALPVSAYVAFHSYQEYVSVAGELKRLERTRAIEEGYLAKVDAYRAYSAAAGEFVASAETVGLTEASWTPYEVAIKERPVDVRELFTVLRNARHGPGTYFRPTVLELRPIREGDGATREFLLTDGEGRKVDRALLTLEGRYLVFNRR